MATYSEKLKNPLWQKKRLEILQRDDFTCQHCGDVKNTLHVHHLAYLKFMDPWEYEPEYLVTLCEKCHGIEETKKDEVKKLIDSLVLACQTVNPLLNILNKELNA